MHFSIGRWSISAKAFALCVMTVSLCAAARGSDANRGLKASPRTASAALQLSVFVIPILEANETTALKRQDSSITFNLASPPLTQNFEVRILPPVESNHSVRQEPAILRTLTIVPK